MLLASDLDNQPMFSGYGWAGSDLIFENRGFQNFHESRGQLPNEQMDGCYILATVKDKRLEVSVDNLGLRRIFLYKNKSRWAISDSLFELAAHAASRKWPLSCDLAQLWGIIQETNLTNQLSSRRTLFRQIQLIPTWNKVEIVNNRVRIRKHPHQGKSSYSKALSNFLSLWSSRIETLIGDTSRHWQVDLSGGLDSRSTFALCALNKVFWRAPFTISSSSKMAVDYAIASEITAHFDLPINTCSQPASALSPKDKSVENWLQYSFATYFPVYQHPGQLCLDRVHVHGGGGELLRSLGSSRRFVRRILSIAKGGNRYLRKWSHGVLVDATWAMFHHRVSLHDAHYREYRNRLHFGHKPSISFMLLPFESAAAIALRSASDKRIGLQNLSQFDIINNCFPDLLGFVFDSPSKSPTVDDQRSLSRIGPVKATKGEIWGEKECSNSGFRSIRIGRQSCTLESVWPMLLEESLQKAQNFGELIPLGLLEKHVREGNLALSTADKGLQAKQSMLISTVFALEMEAEVAIDDTVLGRILQLSATDA